MNTDIQSSFDGSFSVPNVVPDSTSLLRALMEPELGISDVLGEIEQVSSVVAKLISLANSAWSNPLTTVTGIDEACTRLGLNLVRAVAIGIVVGRTFDAKRCKHFDPICYWTNSIVTSNIAALLSRHFEVEVTTARTAGLLHNIGLLLLADRFPDATGEVLEIMTDESTLDDRLEDACGIGYWEAGSRLLKHWELPEALVSSLQDPAMIEDEPYANTSKLVRLSATMSSFICREKELCQLANEQVDQLTLQTIFDEQTSNFEDTTELTKLLVSP